MKIPYQVFNNSLKKKEKMNLFEFKEGGIYKTVCLKNVKIYYGQTDCFIRRCYQHLRLFKLKNHFYSELQKDVLYYGLNHFLFEIVVFEKNLSKRLQLEKDYIKNTKKRFLYNNVRVHNFKTEPRVAQRVKIYDTIYMSIRDASRKLNMSTRNIGLKLNDISNTDYKRLDYHKNSYFDTYEVKIGSTYFDSTRTVVDKGLAKTTRQVRDRCLCS